MPKLLKPGRIMFATGMLLYSILCIIYEDFRIGRPPKWPEGFNINPALAYVSAGMILLATVVILFEKRGLIAALVIAGLIFLLSVLRHLPHFADDWVNGYKALALAGGSLIIAASFIDGATDVHANWRRPLILAGTLLLSVFFIACGWAHFKWAQGVQTLIPEYIPFRLFWTYFCGVCLLAGGVGILLPKTKKWAAFLTGLMIFGWFLLLHIPRLYANFADPSDRMGVCESLIFSGILFVLAALR